MLLFFDLVLLFGLFFGLFFLFDIAGLNFCGHNLRVPSQLACLLMQLLRLVNELQILLARLHVSLTLRRGQLKLLFSR